MDALENKMAYIGPSFSFTVLLMMGIVKKWLFGRIYVLAISFSVYKYMYTYP